MEKTYMHTGIPVAEKVDGMSYMEGLKVWICNNDEYKIEYLYWENVNLEGRTLLYMFYCICLTAPRQLLVLSWDSRLRRTGKQQRAK